MMKESTARPNRRKGPYNGGRNNMSSGPATRDSEEAPLPRVSTPPLAEPVPTDTMRFADLGKDNLLDPILLKTITEDLKFDHMMPVQSATLHDLLEKRIDVLAQAKTGTGKTIAFLLPAIQTMINKNRGPKPGVSLLVISPTRELAMQIAKEATALLQRLPQYKVSFAIGGTNKDREEAQILRGNGCDILIATPGRLIDHLGNEAVQAAFRNLDTLVLDEADRLLDMGFMPALKDIVRYLPDKEKTKRQGMLFSATIAPHVQKVAHLILNKDYKFISTIKEGDVNTHERVPQTLITVPDFADVAPALVSTILNEMAHTGKEGFKCIIFAPTAAMSDWYAAILQSMPGMPSIDSLHARVSQSKRTKITEDFRQATSSILVATDVIARGMDFPNVSTVFQVGIPADKESYIHRLGRTARAGREGRAVFIVTELESFFPKYTLKEINFNTPATPYTPDPQIVAAVEKAAAAFDNKAKVYQAWLGFYKNQNKAFRVTDEGIVAVANRFALQGLISGEVPALEKSTVGKMGLKGVRGVNIKPNEPKAPRGGRGGGAAASGGGEGRTRGSGGLGQVAPPADTRFGGQSGRGRGGGGGGAPSRGGRGGGRGGRVGRGGGGDARVDMYGAATF